MSFVQREVDRMRAEILRAPNGNRRAELYAAQQALSWALEPIGFRAPYDMIMGTQAEREDYPAEPGLPVEPFPGAFTDRAFRYENYMTENASRKPKIPK